MAPVSPLSGLILISRNQIMDPDYRSPEFDPTLVTVAELVRILTKENIALPAVRQKKHVYCDLFREHRKSFGSPLSENSLNMKRTASHFTKENPFQSPRAANNDNTPARKPPQQVLTPGIAKDLSTINFAADLEFGKVAPPQFSSPAEQVDSPVRVAKKRTGKAATPSTRSQKRSPVKFIEQSPFAESFGQFGANTPTTAIKDKPIKAVRKAKAKPTMLWWHFGFSVLVSLIALYCLRIYRARPRQYCDLGTIANNCIPCPQHAMCTQTEAVCDAGFKPKFGVLKYFNLPFPFNQPQCVADNELVLQEMKQKQQLDNLVMILDNIVRRWIGNTNCGARIEPELKWVYAKDGHVLGMPLSLAKTALKQRIGKAWKQDKFAEYWGLIVQRLNSGESDVSMLVDETHSRRMLTSSSPPIMSTWCIVKKASWKALITYSPHLIALGLTLVAGFLSFAWYKDMQHESKIVHSLITSVLDAIHSETEHHLTDPIRHPIAGLSVAQLCDHFLPKHVPEHQTDSKDTQGRAVFHITEEYTRNRIWAQVQKQILSNSNVRESILQVKGEPHTVWMWIGSSFLSPVKKRRVSDVQDVQELPASPLISKNKNITSAM